MGFFSIPRFGKGVGREYSEAYSLEYWRQGMQGFKRYRDSMGREVSNSTALVKC